MIFPTGKALEAYAGVKGLAGEVYERALAGLSPQDRRSLVKGILKLIENLSDDETPSCQSANATKSAESAAK
jgi:hypothetical protein